VSATRSPPVLIASVDEPYGEVVVDHVEAGDAVGRRQRGGDLLHARLDGVDRVDVAGCRDCVRA
jgi:hypothetical protein